MPGIDSFNPLFYSQATLETVKKSKKEEDQKKTEKTKSRFVDLLRKAEDIPATDPELPIEIASMDTEEALVFLMDEVTMAGEELKNSPLPEAYQTYKKKITQFIHFVSQNSYDVKVDLGIRSSRSPTRKKYTIVTVVNEKLEQLARDILLGQSNQMLMLAKIEEIKGLLVDLVS